VKHGYIRLGEAFAIPAPSETYVSATVFFRPEDVEVSETGDGQPVRVEAKVFLGARTRLRLSTEWLERPMAFEAELPSREAVRIAVGSLLQVTIKPTYVRIFWPD
jgi:hypothetical protein